VAYYKALQQHAAALCFIFFFCGGFSLFESRGRPSSVMLEPDKSTPFLQLLYVILPFSTMWLNQEGILE